MASSAFIDRIEGSQAVLLIDDKEVVVARKTLPKGAKEGVWLTPDLKAIDFLSRRAGSVMGTTLSR